MSRAPHPDDCTRCGGTGYAGPHGDTCSRCEGSGVDARVLCEGGCGKTVRESSGMCRACRDQEDEEQGITRDAFGYPIRPAAAKSRKLSWGFNNPQAQRKQQHVPETLAACELCGDVVKDRSLRTVLVLNRFKKACETCVREGGYGRTNPTLAAYLQEGRGLRVRDLIPAPARHGSGPRGGYQGDERSRLPTSAFLKPRTRSWPVSDVNHAHIALQYMNMGRGNRSEYPALIRSLAKHWPVDQNPDIWQDYISKKSKIEAKCGCIMPTIGSLRNN